MKKLSIYILFCLLGFLRAEDSNEPVHVDEALGLAFPAELAGLHFQSIHDYSKDGKGLGYSLRYVGKGPQKLDLYLYDKEIPEIPDGVEAPLIIKESQSLVDELRYVEKTGQYGDMKVVAENEKIEADSITFLRNRFEYVQNQKPAFAGTLASQSLLTGWGGDFVKVRYTYALSEREQGETIAKELPGALAALLKAGGDDVREQIRKSVLAAIEAFRKNPHDESAGVHIATYTIDSDAVSVTLSGRTLPWLREDTEPNKNETLLLIAFMAGNIEPQIKAHEDQDHSYEGILQLIQTYQLLRKKDNIPEIPEVESWINLQENGKLHTVFQATSAEE